MAKSAKERMAEMRTRQRELGRNSRNFWLTPAEEAEIRNYLEILRGSTDVSNSETSQS